MPTLGLTSGAARHPPGNRTECHRQHVLPSYVAQLADMGAAFTKREWLRHEGVGLWTVDAGTADAGSFGIRLF